MLNVSYHTSSHFFFSPIVLDRRGKKTKKLKKPKIFLGIKFNLIALEMSESDKKIGLFNIRTLVA